MAEKHPVFSSQELQMRSAYEYHFFHGFDFLISILKNTKKSGFTRLLVHNNITIHTGKT